MLRVCRYESEKLYAEFGGGDSFLEAMVELILSHVEYWDPPVNVGI